MKNIFLYTVLFLSCFFTKAQTPTYLQLSSVIKAKMPDVDLTNKIIAIHVWSSTNTESRSTNQQFDKVFQAYEHAKLKNGTKGVVIVSCNTDENVTTAKIISGKDGIVKLVTVYKSEFSELSNAVAGNNVVYDNTFKKIFENLPSEKVFGSFQTLITR